ncbi:lysozyme [Reyranella sp.]|uniref:lysozyme n=1 Tax=Reyranella sp. TaxID=1929291 RepID=UPI003BAB47A7
MPREINPAGYRLIEEFEAGPLGNARPALVPYRCPAGRLTIGWGHTAGVRPGMAITEAEAHALLDADLDAAESCVEGSAMRRPTDNEFAAMVSLCFNIGEAGFRSSTVLRLHNRGDAAGAAAAFGLWRKMTDPETGRLVDSAGLIRRRGVEADLYLTPAIEAPSQAMPQVVAAERPAVASRTVIAGGVAVASGAASIADQIDQVTPVLTSLTSAGASLQGLMKLGGAALSVVALAAVGYMLWRYLQKRRRGEVLST